MTIEVGDRVEHRIDGGGVPVELQRRSSAIAVVLAREVLLDGETVWLRVVTFQDLQISFSTCLLILSHHVTAYHSCLPPPSRDHIT